MGKNSHDTNGEFVEAVHYSFDGHEDKRKFKVTRNIGTDEHLKKAIQSQTTFNSLRVGSPKRIMSLKKGVLIHLWPDLPSFNSINISLNLTSIMTILFICIYANLASHIYFLLVDPSKIRPLREILDLGTLRCGAELEMLRNGFNARCYPF